MSEIGIFLQQLSAFEKLNLTNDDKNTHCGQQRWEQRHHQDNRMPQDVTPEHHSVQSNSQK